MKIVMIHGKYFNSWEALGLAYIAAYLKKHVEHIELVFFQGSFDTEEDVIRGSIDADIVCFSATSPSFKYCLEIAIKIKNENSTVRIIFGGYHPSALPLEVLKNKVIDQVVVGEGENAML